jgi:hypothetical protein
MVMKNLFTNLSILLLSIVGTAQSVKTNNPIITDKYTGDPAALVYKDKVYLYAGHDEAPNDFHFYKMNEWLVYSSSDMKKWEITSSSFKSVGF